MNTSINFNEVRKLAAQIGKTKPTLGHMRIKDGTAAWTDGYFLVVMEGYTASPDAVINLADFSINNQVAYPEVQNITKGPFHSKEYTQTILDGQIIYEYVYETGFGQRVLYLDTETLNQLKRLVSKKKFEVNVNELEFTETGSLGKLHVDPLTKVYFVMKRRSDK